MKRKLCILVAILAMILVTATGCSSEEKEVINVLNYDIYIDKTLITDFEKENNVTIKYDTYSTPEEMYIKAN